jgi:hypothetical protein
VRLVLPLQKHAIVDMCGKDPDGCGWVPLTFHPIQVLVQLGFSDGTVGAVEVREECEAWYIAYFYDWIEHGANVDFGHIGLKLVALHFV